jgi:hypothetical protein
LSIIPAAGAAEDVTFHKHVAPILWKNCAGCHRPGEVGPFSLLTYQDASKRAKHLVEVTASRRMPPWKPEPGHGDFRDARRLSDAELATLAAWVKGGAKEGDAKDLAAKPYFPDGWQLGQPDLILKMPATFEVHAGGRDIYRNFVIPTGLMENRTVAAVEFRPGNRRVVHHALFFLDSNGAAKKKEGKDGKPGYSTFGGVGIIPTGSLGGWAPGATPYRLPEGLGKPLHKGSDLVLQIHYHPSGKPETDQSMVGIHFTKKPAEKTVIGIPLVNFFLSISPGEKRYKAQANFTLPVDVEARGISPHMHLIGKEMKVDAILPDGKQVPLIWIKDWDFNWQGAYVYKKPIDLPKGTKLQLVAYYDNSADNPKNPSDPPKFVRWGEQTTDEMCLCGVHVVAKQKDEAMTLWREIMRSRTGRIARIFGGPPED